MAEGETSPGLIVGVMGLFIQAPRMAQPQSFSHHCDVHNTAGLSSGPVTAQTSDAFPKEPWSPLNLSVTIAALSSWLISQAQPLRQPGAFSRKPG